MPASTEFTPLVRIRKKGGKVEEITIGDCAVTMVLGIIIVAAVAMLLAMEVIRLPDIAPLLRAVMHTEGI
jgi:hypothetical protein